MIKLALRNLVRLPWRTVLYFAVVFLLITAVAASLFVYRACEEAQTVLDENYIFVASMVQRKRDAVSLRDIGYCLDGTEVSAVNVSISGDGWRLVGGEYLTKMPAYSDPADADIIWIDPMDCKLVGVENLYLTYPFFTGECTIVEGTGITEAGYRGERAEILVPWYLAEQYGLRVGDEITRAFSKDDSGRTNYMKSTVVGIYKTSALSPSYADYPAYMPFAVAEMDYTTVLSMRLYPSDKIVIERADFVLAGRDSFEAFVLRAKENGLNFQNANLVFNNATYDMMKKELENIHMIALIVCVAVACVGFCALIFFTAYLCYSRKAEITLLRALGMPAHKVFGMLATELLLIAVLAVGGGIFGGYFAADTVCSYVNDGVLENASVSEQIESFSADLSLRQTAPMERKIELSVSVGGASVKNPEMDINRNIILKENEIGISRHLYYNIGSNLEDFIHGVERIPTEVVGITDLSLVPTSVTMEEIKAREDYYEDFVYVFVSEDFDLSTADRGIIYLTNYSMDGYVSISSVAQNITGAQIPSQNYVKIVGTYAENPFCSGSDMLVCMEDYDELYHQFSITDQDFYFERIGEIIERESLE